MDSHYHAIYLAYSTLLPFDRRQESKTLDLDLILDSRCAVVTSSCLLNIHYLLSLLQNETVHFFFHFQLCCFSSTVVWISPPPLPPPQPSPSPSPDSNPLFAFMHLSFIVVPENSSPLLSHYPLPPPLWLLSCCS